MVAVALLLLALRLLAPAGFMPQWGSSGFRLELCDGVATVPAGHHGTDHSKKKAAPPCPYAAAAGHSAVSPIPFELLTSLPPQFAASWFAISAFLVERRVERPRSRGPPLAD